MGMARANSAFAITEQQAAGAHCNPVLQQS